MPEMNGKTEYLTVPQQTVKSIRPADRMNPGVALLLVIALVSGFLKLFMPWLGLRWEFCFLLVGVAAVLVLDSIRAAVRLKRKRRVVVRLRRSENSET